MNETRAGAVTNGMVGEGVGFERIRRITGYLVGTLDRFNNGKRAEERDRVKHAAINGKLC
ncbi:MAG: anaerobic ribonucleoside-triphosphate reductase [Oscillospiraceae bacterium]